MGIFEKRVQRILDEQKESFTISVAGKEIKEPEDTPSEVAPNVGIPSPNTYLRPDAFSFIYKESRLYLDVGTLPHIKMATAHDLKAFDQYRDPAGRGLKDRSVISMWFSYDEAFDKPYCEAIFALHNNSLIDRNTKIEFYDTEISDEHTTVKAFIKDFYNDTTNIRLFKNELKLSRFDKG